MSRCSGCGGACTCVIKEGAGAAVTGAGSVADPYVVALAGGGGGGADIPVGSIWGFAGAAAPVGWLICDGSTRTIALFPVLAAVLGSVYDNGVAPPAGSFRLPDLAGRFLVGADATRPRGVNGGAETATLGVGNLPPHNHTLPTHTHVTAAAGLHAHDSNPSPTDGSSNFAYRQGQAGGALNKDLVRDDGTHTHAVNANASGQNTGNGTGIATPVPILPPFQPTNFIIRSG